MRKLSEQSDAERKAADANAQRAGVASVLEQRVAELSAELKELKEKWVALEAEAAEGAKAVRQARTLENTLKRQ